MSETPRESASQAPLDDSTAPGKDDGGSMSMDMLDTPGSDGTADATLGLDSGDGGTMLLAHERKLSMSEQRRIVAGRKQHGDGIDEDDRQALGGGRRGGGRGRWRGQQGDGVDADSHRGRHGGGGRGGHGVAAPTPRGGGMPPRFEGDPESTADTSGGTHLGNNDNAAAAGSTSGGTAVEKEAAPQAPATDAPREGQAAASTGTVEPRDVVRLDDPSHTHAPLYDTTLKAVAELAPANAALSAQEHANVAAALTAQMANSTAFAPQAADPSQVSFGLAQNGERLFAINHTTPDALNAVHVSVDLQQARQQAVDVSSAQVDPARPLHEAVQQDPVAQMQAQQHAPRQV